MNEGHTVSVIKNVGCGNFLLFNEKSKKFTGNDGKSSKDPDKCQPFPQYYQAFDALNAEDGK